MGIVAFLDRDGVLNVERKDYVKSWDEFQWLPGAQESVAFLNSNHIPVYIISNQSAVCRGIISIDMLHTIHRALQNELQKKGAHIDGIYVCPHAPEMRCACRKPEPGLFLQAAKEHHITLSDAWFIGDSKTDLLAGKRAGTHVILIRTNQNNIDSNDELAADYTCNSLAEAVDFLIKNYNSPQRREDAEENIKNFN